MNKLSQFLASLNKAPSPEPTHTNRRMVHQGHQQQQQYSGNVMGVLAQALVAGSATVPTYTRQRGFASTAITRTSAGIYVLTLLNALDIAGGDGVILGAVNGTTAVGACAQFSPTSATTITVTLCTLTAVPAAAAADLSFWIMVIPTGPN